MRDYIRNDEFNNNGDPKHKVVEDMGGSPEPRKTWIIERKKVFGKTVSEERYDYAEALRIFNEKTTSGVDAILYEVQRSPVDSSIIKKTPILNSVKARRRREEEPASSNKDKLAETKPKTRSKAGNLKLRIVLLIAVIGALLLIISLITALTNRGGIIVYPHSIILSFDTEATTTAVPTKQSHQEYAEFNTPYLALNLNNFLIDMDNQI
ncbi:MAG: hypothetical protein M3P20_01600, partial [Thermoproteota archaeon]|nr:hypothetical protein [Thermoproteota archaeon]